MNMMTIIAVLIVSVLVTLVFVVGLKSRGPWGSGWTFFITVGLWLAAVSLWIPPAGPVWGGAAWIDLVVTALLVSFVLSATSLEPESPVDLSGGSEENKPDHNDHPLKPGADTTIHIHKSTWRTGGLFWMLLLCLCALIIIGAV